ncbi:hypothetical protein CONPUDRAFT_135209 [Coniophora puteana RWD-64-598 SS2]|uniref:Uncharacterized protein n=1 Tax=Coniophora puteana (strain RWD-64-598) TaxID=741705 RepID=A0A5M3N262_CONPW|nr:uncharacterized protein CONPUDRAFT_135209 [Coniophora puteana RWD-64-598 SS2]EIW85469.1 hypothetical protein CONPUDRAFT_135209 [Coniophora puteana RWD-64-598 SS2]
MFSDLLGNFDGTDLKSVKQIANVLSVVGLFGCNAWTVLKPNNNGYWWYWRYAHYLNAREWVFGISWSVIDLLLLGVVLYQFTPNGQRVVIDGIGWRFPALAVLNAIFVVLRAERVYIASFIFSLLIYACVTEIYYRLKKVHIPSSLGEEVYVHVPFSLWHGWSTFLVLLSIFEAFAKSTRSSGVGMKILAVVALLLLEATSAAYAYCGSETDVAGSIVISLALWAVFDVQHHEGTFICWATLISAVLSLVWVGVGAVKLIKKLRGGAVALDSETTERTPLIGNGP